MNSENVKGNESYFSRNPESTAFVRILQQPQEFYRIRHESAPNHPTLLAETRAIDNSHINDILTFIRVEIVNAKGPATLIVSCVSADEANCEFYKLVGQNCQNGFMVLNIEADETIFELRGVSICHTQMTEMKTLPDVKNVRLCFQVFLREWLECHSKMGICNPVLSNVISHQIAHNELNIVQSFNLTDDFEIASIFFQKPNETMPSSINVKFNDNFGWVHHLKNVHVYQKSVVYFKAPDYIQPERKEDVKVFFKLYVPFESEEEKTRYYEYLARNGFRGPLPDGKYESELLEYVYKGKPQTFKRSICDNETNLTKRIKIN